MSQRLTALDLFEQRRAPGLRWVAGQQGQSRVLEAVEITPPAVAGRLLNIIYPNKVQILGSEELARLMARFAPALETIERVIGTARWRW